MEITSGVDKFGNRVAYFDNAPYSSISKGDFIAELKNFEQILLVQLQSHLEAIYEYTAQIHACLQTLAAVIPYFNKHESDKFLISDRVIKRVQRLKAEQNYIDAVTMYYESAFFWGILDEIVYKVRMSPSAGAYVDEGVNRTPAYINACLTNKMVYRYEATDAKAEAERDAEEINSSYEIFECKGCGSPFKISKGVLEYNSSHGISLEDQCENCRMGNSSVVLPGPSNYFSSEESSKVRIFKVTGSAIIFEDGSKISYDHEQDCCEDNYADFEQLDDIARNAVFDTKHMVFEAVPKSGFRFGNPGNMFFIPCYSEQNGYYTDEISIYYNDEKVLDLECKFVDTSD